MKIANNVVAFLTFLLIGTIFLIGPALLLHFTIAGWSPVYIPGALLNGSLFMASWSSLLATAITLLGVLLAMRFAARSTRMHVRGKAAGLGGHPVLQVFGSGLVLLGGYAALGGATLATEWMALVIAFMIATLVGFFLAAFCGGLLIASAVNARYQFRPAVEALEKGFKPSLIARDFTGNGICMVDQENRRVFVNRTTCGFENVSSLRCEDEKALAKIRVALSSGDQPVKTIGYQSTSQRDQDFQRLGNALGLV